MSKNAHFNNLSPAESERLAVLIEEMAESIKEACKILRHGYDSRHPSDLTVDNRVRLANEIGHVECAVQRLVSEGDLSKEYIKVSGEKKWATSIRYLHHQPHYEYSSAVKEYTNIATSTQLSLDLQPTK